MEMSCIKSLLESVCIEVESELKPKLSGFLTGVLISGYLPQHWVFKTESEKVTFSVDRNGNASVKNKGVSKPDVTIDTDHDFLAEVLRTRVHPSHQPKRFKITRHTSKGKTAFDFLRGRFGL
jgi:hypothetical protein